MKSYAEVNVFTANELSLLRKAEAMLERIPYELDVPIRCHELARAAGNVLGLEVCDGRFGFVEHSWLWTEKMEGEKFCAPWSLPNVLDVYVPGAVPQVQLIHMATGLPSRYFLTSLALPAIDQDIVRWLEKEMRYQLKPTCKECGGDLGGHALGRLEEHVPGCPRFPL